MAIPDYQALMLPVLKAAANREVRVGTVIEMLADQLQLTHEERSELLPSGRQPVFSNRVHWAKTYLDQAGLVEKTRRAHFVITERGRQCLSQDPARIDNDYLTQFPEFQEFRRRKSGAKAEQPTATAATGADDLTPDEVMRSAHREIEQSLREDLLDRVLAAPPEFFEQLVVNLLIEMGYGGSLEDAGRTLGQSGDGGVDGVIDQDALGLDRVYVQAKRYAPDDAVSAPTIRGFFGSLDRFKAAKGLVITTSKFTREAINEASQMSKRIVLIDGDQLAALMIRYNVGCRIDDTLYLKKIDEDFFPD